MVLSLITKSTPTTTTTTITRTVIITTRRCPLRSNTSHSQYKAVHVSHNEYRTVHDGKVECVFDFLRCNKPIIILNIVTS